jgi:hypothetical protein
MLSSLADKIKICESQTPFLRFDAKFSMASIRRGSFLPLALKLPKHSGHVVYVGKNHLPSNLLSFIISLVRVKVV